LAYAEGEDDHEDCAVASAQEGIHRRSRHGQSPRNAEMNLPRL
jgi:hypothetical protein